MAEKVVDRLCSQLRTSLPCRTATRALRSTMPIENQVQHAIVAEKAFTLADWYLRRTSIGYGPGKGLDSLDSVAAEFASLLGWSEVQREIEVQNYVIAAEISDHRTSRV